MRNVLVPTDFSDNAMNALRYTLELFKHATCQVVIMHAYRNEIYDNDKSLYGEMLHDVTQRVGNRSQLQLENILREVQISSSNPRHTYSIISANNGLLDEADQIVDEKNIDIIVMGTRGKTNDRKLTFGSQTLQVLKYVQCPVLAVPEAYKGDPPRHILFPTNYLIPFKKREIKFLSDLASSFKSTVDMLYIAMSGKLSLRQENNQSFLKDTLGENQVNFNSISNKNITNTIYTYIKENNVDMLVMVNTRHSFLENILFQSTIDKVSLYLDIPFLALQNIRHD